MSGTSDIELGHGMAATAVAIGALSRRIQSSRMAIRITTRTGYDLQFSSQWPASSVRIKTLRQERKYPVTALVGILSDIEIYQNHLGTQVADTLAFMDRTFIDRTASELDHRKAQDIALAVLDGRTTVLEAARALVSLAHTDAIPDVEDRKLIIAVESETDHLPVGEVRNLWASDALKEKDVEIARAEALYRDAFLQACKRIAVIARGTPHE